MAVLSQIALDLLMEPITLIVTMFVARATGSASYTHLAIDFVKDGLLSHARVLEVAQEY